jgi:hypothetical protein
MIVVRVGLGISSNGSASLPQSQEARSIPNISIVTSHEDPSGIYSVKPTEFPTSVGGVKRFDVEGGYLDVGKF